MIVPLLPLAAAAAPPPLRTVLGTYEFVSKSLSERAGHAHTYEHFLDTPVGYYKLRLPKGKAQHLQSGTPIRVRGTISGLNLAADEVQVAGATPPPPPSTGTTSVLVILAKWSGAAATSVTQSSATSVFFTGTKNDNAYFREASYGALGISGRVTPWVTIQAPGGADCYSYMNDIMTRARLKAQALGSTYDYTRYHRTVVFFPKCAGTYAAGWANQPGNKVWINGVMNIGVTVHEMGHNYGLWHANAWRCTSGGVPVTTGGSCHSEEYGDPFDAMAAGNDGGHFNGVEKDRLGWLTNRKRAVNGTSTTPSSFTLAPLEKNTTTPVVAVISSKSTTRKYYVEYRQPLGYDSFIEPAQANGVQLRFRDTSIAQNSQYLDVLPGDDQFFGSAVLRAGKRWTSSDGVRITVGTVSATGATVTVVGGQPAGTVPGVPRSVAATARDGSVRVTWQPPASDGGSSVDSYHITRTDSTAVYTAAGSATHFDVPNLTNGTAYMFTVKARNAAGRSAGASVWGKPVVMPPTVAFSAPGANATVGSPATVTVTATPNATMKTPIERVEVFAGTQLIGSAYSASYTTSWEPEVDGPVTLKAVAYDQRGRSGTATRSVTVSIPKPSVSLTSPQNGATLTTDTVTLTATAVPGPSGHAISSVRFYSGTTWIATGYSDGAGVYSGLWSTEDVSGSQTIVAKAEDSAGHVGTSEPITVSVTHPPPTVAVTAPTAGATVQGSSVTLSATAAAGSTDQSVSSVTFLVDGQPVGTDYYAPYSIGWDISQITGQHSVTAVVRESYPYRTATSAAVPITVDNPVPTVAITSPTSGTLPIGTVQIAMTATPHSGTNLPVTNVTVYLDGIALGAAQPNGSGGYTYAWQPGSDYGDHTLIARATDSSGKVGRSAELQVEVPYPAPVVTITSPTDGALVTQGLINVTATLSRDPRTNSPIDTIYFQVDDDYANYAAVPTSGNTVTKSLNLATAGVHTIRVVAWDEDGYRGETEIEVQAARVPNPPTSVKAVAGSNGTATVSWVAPANGGSPITQYRVSTGTTVQETTALSSAFSGLINGKSYTFTVSAKNAIGWSTGATSNAVTPGIRTSLTHAVSTATLTYGQKLTVTGTLKRADTGAVLGGKSVQLLSCARGTLTCAVAQTQTTTSSGTVRFTTWGPGAHRDIRLRFLSSNPYVSATTVGKYVQVRAALTSALNKTSAPLGSTVTMTGYVRPAHSGKSVELQRYVNGAWGYFDTVNQSSTGYVTYPLKAPFRGTFTFRWYFPGDADHLAGSSAARTFSIT